MKLTFRPAIEYPLDTLVALLNRGFEGYVVNIRFSRPSLLSVLTRDSVDLALSQVAEVDGAPVAIGLIARRGWTARLAAMGVATESRGQGIGKGLINHLIDGLTGQGFRQFILEVIEQNPPAVGLYEQAGFETIGRLIGLNHSGANQVDEVAVDEVAVAPTLEELSLEEIDITSVARKVTADPLPDLPWQLSGTSLMVSGRPDRAYQLGSDCLSGGMIVISDPKQPTISIRSLFVAQESRGQGHAARLVAAVMAQHPNRKWAVSAICPEALAPIFTRSGFQVGELSQLQMKRKL